MSIRAYTKLVTQGCSHRSGIKVSTYPLFSKLPERFLVLIIQKWVEPAAIEFDISCVWIFRSYFDVTRHLDSQMTHIYALETPSDCLKIQTFLGGAHPQTPMHYVQHMPHPLWPLIFYLTFPKFVATAFQ